MDDQWLTVEQVAARVQAHPDTVRRWLREGKINGNLINRRAGWRIRASSVERFLAGDPDKKADRGESSR